MNLKSFVVFILLITSFFGLTACKKDAPKSSDKYITSFVFMYADNPQVVQTSKGVIVHDTIYVGVKENVPLTNLVPTIEFKGASISPDSKQAQDFSNPVRYTLTGGDGSMRIYVVVVKHLSSSCKITSFILKKENNPSLTSDVAGVIRDNSISVHLPTNANKASLIPTIVHTGKTVTPANEVAANFNNSLTYTVTTEDGSLTTYKVVSSNNKAVYFGSQDGYVYALDATDGTLLWKYLTGGAVNSSPAYHDNTLFVGSSDYHLYALDATTGTLKWKAIVFDPIVYSPVVDNGFVYVADIDIEKQTYLYSFNEKSGERQWYLRYGNVAVNGPSFDKTSIYLGGFAGFISVDRLTGKINWQFDADISKGNPLVSDGTVYTASAYDAKLYCIDAATGKEKWKTVSGMLGSTSSPTVYNSTIFVVGMDGMYAIDSANGSVKWIYSGGTEGVGITAPVAGQGLIFGADTHGRVTAINATTGVEAWVYESDAVGNYIPVSNVTYSNGFLFGGSNKQKLTVFDASNGQVKWTYRVPSEVYSGPCVLDADGKTHNSSDSGMQD